MLPTNFKPILKEAPSNPLSTTDLSLIIIDDGYHGDVDQERFIEDDVFKEDDQVITEEHIIENNITISDSTQNDHESSQSVNNSDQSSHQSTLNSSFTQQEGREDNQNFNQTDMGRGVQQVGDNTSLESNRSSF